MPPNASHPMEIILCVPGKWKDRSELVIALAAMKRTNVYPRAGAALYRIIESECIFYEKEHRFYNPYGMYYLKEVE